MCEKSSRFFFFFAKNIEWLQILQNRQLQMGKAQKKKKKVKYFGIKNWLLPRSD